jgi:hypothetical protein
MFAGVHCLNKSQAKVSTAVSPTPQVSKHRTVNSVWPGVLK